MDLQARVSRPCNLLSNFSRSDNGRKRQEEGRGLGVCMRPLGRLQCLPGLQSMQRLQPPWPDTPQTRGAGPSGCRGEMEDEARTLQHKKNPSCSSTSRSRSARCDSADMFAVLDLPAVCYQYPLRTQRPTISLQEIAYSNPCNFGQSSGNNSKMFDTSAASQG